MTIDLAPIGTVRSPRNDRRDDFWGSVESTIEIDERFPLDALLGLDAFSHLEVVFFFHGIREDEIETSARHPRGNPAWPRVGIFAQRGSKRPNRLGISRCALVGIEGRTLRVKGLDAIDGTPVLDIKPYMRAFTPPGDTREPAWVAELMKEYYAEHT